MMWFGVMYWNPAIPPIAAVSIEILEGNRIVLLNWILLVKLPMSAILIHYEKGIKYGL